MGVASASSNAADLWPPPSLFFYLFYLTLYILLSVSHADAKAWTHIGRETNPWEKKSKVVRGIGLVGKRGGGGGYRACNYPTRAWATPFHRHLYLLPCHPPFRLDRLISFALQLILNRDTPVRSSCPVQSKALHNANFISWNLEPSTFLARARIRTRWEKT